MTEHVKNGVDLRFISAEKFKTNVISVFFNIPLRRGSVTRAALLPSVMKRGTSEHRTMAEISRYLDELYSTTLHCGIRAKGDGEVIYKTVAELDGKASSQLMMLVGTGESGLYHPNWEQNLRLAL